MRKRLKAKRVNCKRLNGKTALITGSTSGIGRAVALRYIREGATVVFHSEKPLKSFRWIARLLKAGHHYVQADLADLFDARNAVRLVERAWELTGGIDILVLNAGTYNDPHFLTLGEDTLRRTFELNFFSAFFALQKWAKLVVKFRRKGRVIITGSINGDVSEQDHTGYDSSKAALEGLCRSSAIDLARFDIRVNLIALGLVDTPITTSYLRQPGIREFMNGVIPLGVTKPNEVTGWYVFLGSDESYPGTGDIYPVDGGLRAAQATVGANLFAAARRCPRRRGPKRGR